MSRDSAPRPDRAAVVGRVASSAGRDCLDGRLDELSGLVKAAGPEVVLRFGQVRERPDPATLFGAGKVEQLARACAEAAVDLVVVDEELTPAQLRNLEQRLDRRIIDRTQLILDIFASRARTREGKLQVELAQLRYLLPRLVGASAALSRLGGGIGTRGPGETKLETDRRRIRDRIASLTREIDRVRRRRALRRERRRHDLHPTVALVGYTNAGKTTLFNRLAGTSNAASDALFVTLDPRLRQIKLPDGQVALLSDTVGFIERLPHTLVAAFRATLEEVVEADLLLHVVDASTEDVDRHLAAVWSVLEEVGATHVPAILVLNKSDATPPAVLERLRAGRPDAFVVSARTGAGVEALLGRLQRALELDTERVTFRFAVHDESAKRQIAALYRLGRVVSHRRLDNEVAIEAAMPRRLRGRVAGAAAPTTDGV